MPTNEQLEALLQAGLGHIQQQSFTEALKQFTQAIELAPNDTRPYGYRAQLLAAMGKTQAALADCAKVLRLDPRQPDAWYLMGTLFQKQGDESKAAECLRRAGEYGHPAVVEPSAEAEEAQPTAEPEPEPAPEPEPSRPERIALAVPPPPTDVSLDELFDMALWALTREQYDEAYVGFAQLLARQPDTHMTADAYAYRGWACYQLGYLEDAHADFTLAVTQNSDSIEPYLNRGRVHLNEEEYDEAEDDFRHAAEHAVAHDIRPNLWLGQVALAQNRWDVARQQFEAVLQVEPINETATKMLEKLATMGTDDTAVVTSPIAETSAPTPTLNTTEALALARETLGEFALINGGDPEEIEVTRQRGIFSSKKIKKTRIHWRLREAETEDTAVILDLVSQPRASVWVQPTAEAYQVRLLETQSSGELRDIVNTAVPLTQSDLANWLYDLLADGLLVQDNGRLRYSGRSA